MHFAIYYVTLYCGVALPDIEAKHHLEGFQILDLERYNFEHLFTMHVSVERQFDILKSCNVSDFDILSRMNTSEALVQRLIDFGKRLIVDEIKLWYLTELNLINYCQLLKTILMQYDVHFVPISNRIGNSASFEVYVNLLILLSKADGKVDGQSHRLQTLLSRSEKVEELYHLGSTDDSSSSRTVYAKYYSALANSYIRLNQYDKFLECWQKILFLKKQLQDCENKRCSHLHKGLAYFGRGNYEQAIEHLHPLLKLDKLSASRKARILILLYESYSSIGDVLNAVKILHNHFYDDILVWRATRTPVPVSGCRVKSGFPAPPNIPQFTDAQQPYTEPNIILEDDDTTHQHHHIPGDSTYCRPTNDSANQHLYCQNISSNAHTGIVLELLNQGATRENYITLLITATFIEKIKENHSVHLDKLEFWKKHKQF